VAERTPTGDTLRRAIEAYVDYYQSLGKATGEYVRTLTSILWGVDLPITLGSSPRSSAEDERRSDPAPPPASSAETVTLILEGSSGSDVRSVFAVSNDLDREVSAPVMSTGAVGPNTVLALRASPSIVTLARGERQLVEVGALISEEMVEGADYVGEVSVPGLSASGIPIVVRRVADVERETAPAAKAERTQRASAKGKATGKAAARKTAATKPAAKKPARKAPAKKRAASKRTGAKRKSKPPKK
jgi:hypothetical protein